jgi:hypothetical protein
LANADFVAMFAKVFGRRDFSPEPRIVMPLY